MRLSAFILKQMEPILQEWENFARDLGAVTEWMDAKALRDHAEQILREVAADLETSQSAAQQSAKSKGDAPPGPSAAADSGSQQHGNVRAMEGFTLDQMISEYRALRASVLRLWAQMGGVDGPSEAEQVTRFNEAIDEALAQSIKRYSRDVERLIVSAHANERMATLGTLSAGLGHDISNVLMPMRVSLDQLERTALSPESKVLVESLRRSMEHLRGLTRGLRSLSVDPEYAEASSAITQLDAWWAEATSPYKWALSPAVKLHASGLESLALPAVAVPKHVLMQAVFNLVQNAAEALLTRGGGNIWVSATPVEDGATIALAVRDDGPGMDAKTLARCTEPFFTTKPCGRGTGLGLSLVRTALERHRGRLIIESTPNQGSTFTLMLPVAGRGDQSQSVRHAIVTVGDSRARALVTALLSSIGVQVSAHRPAFHAATDHHAVQVPWHNSLWVVDGSVDPEDLSRFLKNSGPNARIVVLGKNALDDSKSPVAAMAYGGRMIQIADNPSHATLQAALRRAVVGWVL